MQLASRRVYTGRSCVSMSTRSPFRTFQRGARADPASRRVGSDSCASDPAGGDPSILMIRQFRHAAGGLLWEIPAGTLAPGETPEACAHRELREETGVVAARIERLTSIYTTPGFTDEVIHLFLAQGLTMGEAARERDEFIEVVPQPLSQVLAGIRGGEIKDAKTVVAILYMAGFILGL